jgi:ParB/RepB/Spo0J family partition protein
MSVKIAAPTPAWREITVSEIATDGTNPRTLFDLDGDAGLADLAACIKAQGLLQPIIVRANADAPEGRPPYLLVAGERRLRAIRDVLKRPTIAAILRHDLTPDMALEATVLENLQRRDLHPMEEARGLAALRARPGYTPQQIATKLGRRTEWVKDRLTLCDLPATAQDLYLRDTTGRLTLTKMLRLHEYTHGNRDNKGFPRLIEAMAGDIAKGINSDAHPSTTASLHAGLVKRLTHWHNDQGGRYGGNYFDTYNVCRKCPFAAYRSPYGDYEGFCLMPDHYATLQAKGKAAYE